ncbi:MAG TPA: hypothetical protein VFR99_04320, partial [Marmoricola sp.]|nr:hypothetical protein [Marmoricola sp.]
TLQRWRSKVTAWKEMPPAPLPTDGVASMYGALEADLDTCAVLKQLHRLEVDKTVASGSKFAAFLQLDEVFALDLGRFVGRRMR